MVWAKIDDEILDNEKIINAGPLGFALHLAAITWCCRNLTDGFIPKGRVRALLDFEGLSLETGRGEFVVHGRSVEPLDIADELVRLGLWDEDDDRRGYWLHDFLDYNPTREKVLSERERGRVRAKSSYEARAKTDPPGAPSSHEDNSSPEESPKTPESSPEAAASLRCVFGSSSDGPVPVPVPVPLTVNLTPPTTLAPLAAAPDPPASSAPQLALVSPTNGGTKGTRRGTRLPADWAPSQALLDWAREHRIADPLRPLEEFRDYWSTIPGSKGVKLDWEAAYRNRLRQIADRAPSSRGRADTRQPLRDREAAEWLNTGTEDDL